MRGMHDARDAAHERIRRLVRVREGRGLPTDPTEQEIIDELSELTFAKYYDHNDQHVHCGGDASHLKEN